MADCPRSKKITPCDYMDFRVPFPAIVVIVVPNIIGNIITAVVILKTKCLHKFCNFLLVNLAISDIMIALVELTGLGVLEGLLAEVKQTPTQNGTQFECVNALMKSQNIRVFSFPMLQISLLTITVIAIDRYLAVAKPFQAMQQGRIKHLKVIIPCVWLLGFLLTIPIFLSFIDTSDITTKDPSLVATMGSIHFVSSYLLPLVVLVWTYIRISWILKNRQLQIGLSNNKNTALRAQQRATRLLGSVIVVHNCCFFPYAFITFVATQSFSCEVITEPYSYFITHYFLLVSPVINPLIYFFHSKVFRDACKAIFMGKRRN